MAAPLAVGVNVVIVPAREFLASNNAARLPPAEQGIALSVWVVSDSAEELKIYPSENDNPPAIDLIQPGAGVTYKALSQGGWQCVPMIG
jgi:hypothetical protein